MLAATSTANEVALDSPIDPASVAVIIGPAIVKHLEIKAPKLIFLINIWPVHIVKTYLEDFLPWMQLTHPDIFIIFVPSGCKTNLQVTGLSAYKFDPPLILYRYRNCSAS